MSRSKRIGVALVLDLLLVVGEAIVATRAHSTGLLADAGHNLADGVALIVALVAVRLALRAPSARRSFGFHRATILSALVNVAFLLVTMALISVMAIERIVHPLTVHGGLVAITAAIAALINASAAYAVFERSDERKAADLNMKSAFLHLASDALASLGVFLAGIVEFITGRFFILDPIMALLIAVLVGYEAVRIARASIEVLLEAVPADVDLPALALAMSAIPGVIDVHDLHVWSISSELRALSAHVVLDGHPSLEQAQVTGDILRKAISAQFLISHATLELECEPCEQEDAIICAIERIGTPRLSRR